MKLRVPSGARSDSLGKIMVEDECEIAEMIEDLTSIGVPDVTRDMAIEQIKSRRETVREMRERDAWIDYCDGLDVEFEPSESSIDSELTDELVARCGGIHFARGVARLTLIGERKDVIKACRPELFAHIMAQYMHGYH